MTEVQNVFFVAGGQDFFVRVATRDIAALQTKAPTEAPEAHRLAATIEAWWPAIEAGILTGTRTRGRRAKTDWQSIRAAIRWACTRVRREVLIDRAEVRDLCRRLVAAGRLKLIPVDEDDLPHCL